MKRGRVKKRKKKKWYKIRSERKRDLAEMKDKSRRKAIWESYIDERMKD